MEGLKYDIEAKAGKTYNLTVYSDLHFESWACDRKRLKQHMERRAALPNAIFFGIGDFFNCIRPGDPRYQEGMNRVDGSQQRREGRRQRVARLYNSAVNDFVQFAGKYPWKAIGMGNHEAVPLKRHGVDPSADLADALGCDWAGYSGLARFRFHLGSGAGAKCQFNLLYHHGKWGGQSAVPAGAQRWASHVEGWDVFCFGHHHMQGIQPVPRLRFTSGMRMVDLPKLIVATGTALRGYTQGSDPEYSEIAAYPPSVLGAPLIKITPSTHACHYSAEIGEAV